MGLGPYIVQRLIGAAVVVAGVTLAVFIVLRLSGDPAAVFMSPMATREEYDRIRQQMGLDQPLPIQYALYVGRMARGDFGTSYQRSESAMGVVLDRVPATVRLAAAALILILLLSLPLGVAAAVLRGTWADVQISTATLVAQALPNYWVGIMLVLLFAVQLRWLPTSGAETWQSMVLPAVTLALQPCARMTRLVRSELLDVLNQDYMRTARAKGLGGMAVLAGHGLPNAAIPVLTLIGLDVGNLLGGAIIVEAIFAWPGMGSLVVQAMSNQDFPVIQATVLVIAVTMVALNLLTDLAYGWLDPRVRLG